MTDFDWFVSVTKTRLKPDSVKIDSPEHSLGSRWVDITHGTKKETVEYRPDLGFGFFAPDTGYGEGPNLIVASWEVALETLATRLGV